jgi:hypothetical protein
MSARRCLGFLNAILVGLLGVLGVASEAAASPGYPFTLQSEYFPDAPLEPLQLCTYCHTNLAGGDGTVTRPFGMRLRSLGLPGLNMVGELTRIIDELIMVGDTEDSDGDSFGDILELTSGSDPRSPSTAHRTKPSSLNSSLARPRAKWLLWWSRSHDWKHPGSERHLPASASESTTIEQPRRQTPARVSTTETPGVASGLP